MQLFDEKMVANQARTVLFVVVFRQIKTQIFLHQPRDTSMNVLQKCLYMKHKSLQSSHDNNCCVSL